MRTPVRRPLVLACLVGLALLAGYRSALLAQGDPATSAGAAGSPSRFAPGFGGGFSVESKPVQKPLATVYLTAPMTAPAAKTWLKLQETISINFPIETPLEDVLKFIKETTQGKDGKGIPIYVDPAGLQEAEKTVSSPVVLALEDVPLATALSLLLKQIDLTYSVQKDGIVIITSGSTEDPLADPTARILEEISALRLEVDDLRKQLALRSQR